MLGCVAGNSDATEFIGEIILTLEVYPTLVFIKWTCERKGSLQQIHILQALSTGPHFILGKLYKGMQDAIYAAS